MVRTDGTVDLIAGEYDEIGVGSVQLRVEQTERRLLRPGGVLRVGNDKDTEFPIFVKLQHGIGSSAARDRSR